MLQEYPVVVELHIGLAYGMQQSVQMFHRLLGNGEMFLYLPIQQAVQFHVVFHSIERFRCPLMFGVSCDGHRLVVQCTGVESP